MFSTNRLLDNSYYSSTSSKRSISSISKNNLNYPKSKINNPLNQIYSINYSQLTSNSISTNYTPYYSGSLGKSKKYINTEPNLENDIKYINIKETSKNLQKRLDDLISRSKEKKLLDERNQELRNFYYRPSSTQKIQKYDINPYNNNSLKKQYSKNNLNINIINHNNMNQISSSLNHTSTNNSFSNDMNFNIVNSVNRNKSFINKKSNENIINNNNHINKQNIINNIKYKRNKINTPDKIFNNKNSAFNYITQSSREFLDKLNKFPSSMQKYKTDYRNNYKNDSSDLSDLAEDLVIAFDLENKSKNKKNKRKGKEKEYNDLKKDLNIKIFKHFEGEKNDNKFEEEKKIEMNNKIKNEFLFKRQETNSKNSLNVNILKEQDIIIPNTEKENKRYLLLEIENKNQIKPLENEVKKDYINLKKELEINTNKKSEDSNFEKEKLNDYTNKLSDNSDNKTSKEISFVPPMIMSLESVSLFNEKTSENLDNNKNEINESNDFTKNKVKNPFIESEGNEKKEIKKEVKKEGKKEVYDSDDEEADLIINEIIKNANKQKDDLKNNNTKHIIFNLNSTININYNLEDEPSKINISYSNSKEFKNIKEKDMNEYFKLLKSSNKLKSKIKSFDKNKILINENYIPAEFRTEEEIIPDLSELLKNNEENQEHYEYYPIRNEINSLDSIEI